MTDYTQNSDDDLMLDDIEVESDEAVSDDTDDSKQVESEQQEETDLDFLEESKTEVPKKAEAREQTKEGQIKSALKKINAGEKSLSDYPKYIQESLVDKIKAPSEPPRFDEGAIVDKAVKRLKQEQQFESLRSHVQSLSLSSEQAAMLKQEFKNLRQDGLDQAKALSMAIRLIGLSEETIEAEKRGRQLGRMALSPTGAPITMKNKNIDPMSLNDDDYIKWCNAQQSGPKVYKPNN